MIFINKGFRTIVSIFIVISTTFRPICPLAVFRCLLSEFLRRNLMIFINKGFRTIVFIFNVISTTFRPISPPAFFRCLSNSGLGLLLCSYSDFYLGWRIEDNTRKLTTACLPYIKGLAERIQKICSPYDIRTVFSSGSTLRIYLFRVKPPMEFNMIKNCVYSIPCSCGKIYKGETGRPLKVRLEEHRKVVGGEIEKSGMADHIWKEKGNHLPLWDKVEIIDGLNIGGLDALRNQHICWATMTCWVD